MKRDFFKRIQKSLSPKRFVISKERINERNYQNFVAFLLWASLISFATFIVGVSINQYSSFTLEFLSLFGFSLVFYLIARFGLKNHHKHILYWFYGVESAIFALGILLGTFLDPSEPSITIMVLLCVLPIFILDHHWRTFTFSVIVVIAYVICCYFAKEWKMFVDDMVDLAFYFAIATGVNFFTHEDRFRTIEAAVSLEEKAAKDPLTGLNNRRTGVEKITELVEKKTPGAFVITDIDDFKSINDTYGHMVGDQALLSFANMCNDLFGERGNIVFRLGGDEFAFWISDVDSPIRACQELDRAVSQVKNINIHAADKVIKISASFGCVVYSGTNIADFNELYAKADKSLYRAKKAGKDRYIIAS
ncbi:MAG: GGDEF domain-containing protein [Bacilli bacterium]|jgi:diguanylate cyclase (GGDEF)-like protein|nr:GGDEF domain-containing protein [Bacilli bacterium]